VRQVGDARGRPVTLPDWVDRVVSLVPSLTEWLVHAGVGEKGGVRGTKNRYLIRDRLGQMLGQVV
jgi:ABC-type Fe3+-hydroxamate transport system substrate-binding protein